MNVKKVRESLGLTQADFWKACGITQSGGSRYEKLVRSIPRPVVMLLTIAYGSSNESKRVVSALRGK